MDPIAVHNDNARDYTFQRIEETIALLTWYRDVLELIEPTLPERDRRVLMFTLARCADVYRAEVEGSAGILLQVVRHFGVRP